MIYADQNKLRQLIINLLENSQDALKDIKNPKIKISLKKKPGTLSQVISFIYLQK
jgi:C4-dicarboxylate-specific signal transduction histidine kinase